MENIILLPTNINSVKLTFVEWCLLFKYKGNSTANSLKSKKRTTVFKKSKKRF